MNGLSQDSGGYPPPCVGYRTQGSPQYAYSDKEATVKREQGSVGIAVHDLTCAVEACREAAQELDNALSPVSRGAGLTRADNSPGRVPEPAPPCGLTGSIQSQVDALRSLNGHLRSIRERLEL